jgi:hypothetical protein
MILATDVYYYNDKAEAAGRRQWLEKPYFHNRRSVTCGICAQITLPERQNFQRSALTILPFRQRSGDGCFPRVATRGYENKALRAIVRIIFFLSLPCKNFKNIAHHESRYAGSVPGMAEGNSRINQPHFYLISITQQPQ